MKVVKNKSSGRFFIVLEDTGDARFLLCTPEGKIKRLERRLFGQETTANHHDYRWDGNLTKAQMDAYADYDDDDD